MRSLVSFISIVLLILIGATCRNNPPEKMSIVRFDMLNNMDTFVFKGRTLYNKSEYFLIKNYSEGKATELFIDSFVNVNRDKDFLRYRNYSMVFYKISSKTNVEHLTKHPRDLDRYSQDHDLIYRYIWSNGEFLKRYKYKNGEMVPNSDIIVKEITDSIY